MNTNKTGMRTVLAAAAAGALILGSAGGVVADPGKAKGPKKTTSASEPAMTKLQTVRIKGHKKIDLAAPPETISLRAKVRYSKKVSSGDALESFEIKLGVFDTKVKGTFVPDSASGPSEAATDTAPAQVELKAKNKVRKNQFYAGDAVIADVWTTGQLETLGSAVSTNGKAYICTYTVDTELFNAFSKQTRKRLGVNAEGKVISGKTVRDCVKVVNSTVAAPQPPA